MTRRPTDVWKTSMLTRRRTLRTKASRAPWRRRDALVRENPPVPEHAADVFGATTGAWAEGATRLACGATRIVSTPLLSPALSTRRNWAGTPWPCTTYV